MKVHAAVGPGLLESAYESCLLYELEKQGFPVCRQLSIPIRYDDLTATTYTAHPAKNIVLRPSVAFEDSVTGWNLDLDSLCGSVFKTG